MSHEPGEHASCQVLALEGTNIGAVLAVSNCNWFQIH